MHLHNPPSFCFAMSRRVRRTRRLLYYMTRPEYQLRVREEIYLDSSLDLF